MTSPTIPAGTTKRPPTVFMMARAAFADPGLEADAAAAMAMVLGYCGMALPRIPALHPLGQ